MIPLFKYINKYETVDKLSFEVEVYLKEVKIDENPI